MRRLYLFAIPVAFILSFFPVWGQEKQPNQWFRESIFNAGKVIAGNRVEKLFAFSAHRKKQYLISAIYSNCLCAGTSIVLDGKEITAASLKKGAVQVSPATTGGIRVHLITSGKKGLLEAQLLVVTNDPKARKIRLVLQATVEPFFQIEPQKLDLGEIDWDDTKAFTFRVSGKFSQDWRVTKIGSQPPGVVMGVPTRKTIAGKVVYECQGVLGPNLPFGKAGGVIRLKTNCGKRIIELKISATVRQPYKIHPDFFLAMGYVSRRRGKKTTIKITNLEPNHHLRLLEARITKLNRPLNQVKVTVHNQNSGQPIHVVLYVLPHADKGMIRGKLTLLLNHPRQPEKTLQFMAFVK